MAKIISYFNDLTTINNCKYYIEDKLYENTSLNLAFDSQYIYKYANDWLYLLLGYLQRNLPIYDVLLDIYLTNKDKPCIIINGNSLLVSTSFSSGTIHGYVGIFDMITTIRKNKLHYDTYVVHENAQDGIKNIINLSLSDYNIVYLKTGVVYMFDQLTIIPVSHHEFTFHNDMDYIVNNIQPLIDSIFFDQPCIESEKIAIIKNSSSVALTNQGVFNYNELLTFCRINNYVHIEPTDYTEKEYANYIYGCKHLIFSWGTVWMKGLLYISDKCDTILVLISGPLFIEQYNNFINWNRLLTKYKNATISYRIVNDLNSII